MNEKRTGLFENGLIWFGAGVSIAEILTGTTLHRSAWEKVWQRFLSAISSDA